MSKKTKRLFGSKWPHRNTIKEGFVRPLGVNKEGSVEKRSTRIKIDFHLKNAEKILAPRIDGHLDAISLWNPHQTLYKNSPYGGPHWYCYSTGPTIFSRLVNLIYPILMSLTTAYCPNAWLYHMVFVTVDWIIPTQAEVCHHWIYQVSLSYASFWCWCILFKIRPLKNWTDYFFQQDVH